MGKERLPNPGFVLEFIERDDGSIPEDLAQIVHINDDKKCKYNRGDEWWTLLWTCAPTRKQIANSPKRLESNSLLHLIYFKTIDDVLDSEFGYLVEQFNDLREASTS